MPCFAADGPASALPRSSPEAQGVSSEAIMTFIEAAPNSGMHGFVMVRHGHVVAEGWWAPYDAKTRHELYSLSKSFTSTAIGLAIADGKLSIDDPVMKFFTDDLPAEPSNNLKAMRVRDILCMSTGHQTEPARTPTDQNWVKTFLAHPVPFKPGTHFLYNTSATYMQSAIVQKVTGKTTLDYLRPRLFEPLGIEDPTWGTSPQGVTLGGYGLSVRTEDIAKFGQLYLQKGKWGEKQLVPAAWIEAATARQTSNGSNPASDWDQGYGYQFWRCRHNAYRGDGAFGQYCVVLPEQDAVIAITSGVKDMQAVMNLIWDKLLPGMKPAALPANADAEKKLRTRLAGLVIPTVAASPTARIPEVVSGKTFTFKGNPQKLDSVELVLGKPTEPTTLVVSFNGGAEQRIVCGLGEWKKGKAAFGDRPEQTIAACGAWTANDTFTVQICLPETPFISTVTLSFIKDQLVYEAVWNVGFAGPTQPQLMGEHK
ncbi:MAG: beta-lactamase family protein [Planctomycetes bacterium]|nr:beta-lactamase family protein [Planctomycetota bacterium]